MDKEYLNERTKKVIKNLKKTMIQMLLLTIVICATECGVLIRLFQYITINRFDMIAFVVVMGGFFAYAYIEIWKGAQKDITREIRLYKFCVECIVEHEKILQRRAEDQGEEREFTFEIKPRRIALFSGKAKDFKGFVGDKRC